MDILIKVLEMFMQAGGLTGLIIGALLILIFYTFSKQNKLYAESITQGMNKMALAIENFSKDIRDTIVSNTKIETKMDGISDKLNVIEEDIKEIKENTQQTAIQTGICSRVRERNKKDE